MSIVRNASIYQTSAIREGVKIVRNILATHDFSKGLSTAELYQLACKQPAPPGYRGDPRLDGTTQKPFILTLPPQNDHPIRSKSFLKQSILPALVGSKEITKVVTTRDVTTPIRARGKKGKPTTRTTKESAGASLSNPVTVKAWVWKPYNPDPVLCEEPVKKSSEPRAAATAAALGLGEDWSHLNKRREGNREEKIQRDLANIRLVRVEAMRESLEDKLAIWKEKRAA